MAALWTFIAVVGLVVLFLVLSVKVMREYERAVVFRLGRLMGIKGPGLFVLIPLVDQAVRVDLRTVTLNVPPQELITRDNVTVTVNAVAYFRVLDAAKAIVQVENYLVATSQIAQTTLRSVLGQIDLDQLLAERDQINDRLQAIIDKQTAPWGVKVSIVEIKDIELPVQMQRALARQAEAERDRRAKVIAAEGEYQASTKLHDAAQTIAREPIALQLRYLQTMNEIASERTSTMIIPFPIDLFEPFIRTRGAPPPLPPGGANSDGSNGGGAAPNRPDDGGR
jgi:regulator of protease activity HflC (stomatin/prohibitin superfamily)